MKTRLFPIFLLVAFSAASTLWSGPQQSQEEAREMRRENPRLAQRLALSHAQQVQFRAINRERRQQVNAVQSDPSLSPRVRREKIRDIHAAAETRIRGILNQNQLDEYDQMKRERQEQRLRHAETNTPAPAPEAPPAPPPQ